MPASCVCASLRAGRLLFHGSPVALAHFACPHVTVWALLVFARVVEEQALLWACLLVGGWVGCLRAGRVRLLVFAFLGVGVLAWGSVAASAPFLLCLLACSRFWCGRGRVRERVGD